MTDSFSTFYTNSNTMANLRFAYSPLIDLVISFNTLKNNYRKDLYRRWIDEASHAVYGLEFPLMNELILSDREHSERHRANDYYIVKIGRYMPDFLTAAPLYPIRNIEEAFAKLLEIPDTLIRNEIKIMINIYGASDILCDFLAYPRENLCGLIQEMREYWNRALAHHWLRILAVLENDILHHSRVLTLHGSEKLFPELNKRFWYKDNVVYLKENTFLDFKINEDYLYLSPSIFSGEFLWYGVQKPWRPTFNYTPRGVGLWNYEQAAPSQELEILIGSGKASLLMVLSNPLSTGEIAYKLKLTSGAVSQHLAKLHETGLVEYYRNGKRVFYRLTERGQQLVLLFS
jgi:DNA-binding transcriptional ArsR family regulator